MSLESRFNCRIRMRLIDQLFNRRFSCVSHGAAYRYSPGLVICVTPVRHGAPTFLSRSVSLRLLVVYAEDHNVGGCTGFKSLSMAYVLLRSGLMASFQVNSLLPKRSRWQARNRSFTRCRFTCRYCSPYCSRDITFRVQFLTSGSCATYHTPNPSEGANRTCLNCLEFT